MIRIRPLNKSLQQALPNTMVHFIGLHMFYYVIGLSSYAWFLANFSTELDGNPLTISLTYVWPAVLVLYLPVSAYLYRLLGPVPGSAKRVGKYAAGVLVFSFITACSSAGYTSLVFVVGAPHETDIATPVVDGFRPGAHLTYQTTSGARFRVNVETGKKILAVRVSPFGLRYWVDRKF